MTIAELLQAIFNGQSNFLSVDFEEWVKSSRRFRAFAETYRDKIRKKLRLVKDDEALKSLYAELETAYRLLADKRFNIEYEKYSSTKKRGSDFTLTFRVNTICNLEVTRLRFSPHDVDANIGWKLTESVLDKVGQMTPNVMNVLLIISDRPISAHVLSSVIASLRLRAERKEDDFFIHHGFQNAVDFLNQFRQLSTILYRAEGQHGVWNNSLAKKPLLRELENALRTYLIPFQQQSNKILSDK